MLRWRWPPFACRLPAVDLRAAGLPDRCRAWSGRCALQSLKRYPGASLALMVMPAAGPRHRRPGHRSSGAGSRPSAGACYSPGPRSAGQAAPPPTSPAMASWPTTAAHVAGDLNGRIDLTADGGPVRVGAESTIVALPHGPDHAAPRRRAPRGDIERVLGMALAGACR